MEQEYYAPPEPTVVRQMVPQGRTAQRRNRESIEKGLLRARNSNFERYGPEIEDPYLVERGVPSYMSDSDRFHTDTAGEAKKQREVEYDRKNQAAANLRGERLMKDNTRWEAMEEQARIQEEYMHQLRQTGAKTRKNISGGAFNPVTLHAHCGEGGRALNESEDAMRDRAKRRTNNMQRAGNSMFNPITGTPYDFGTPA